MFYFIWFIYISIFSGLKTFFSIHKWNNALSKLFKGVVSLHYSFYWFPFAYRSEWFGFLRKTRFGHSGLLVLFPYHFSSSHASFTSAKRVMWLRSMKTANSVCIYFLSWRDISRWMPMYTIYHIFIKIDSNILRYFEIRWVAQIINLKNSNLPNINIFLWYCLLYSLNKNWFIWVFFLSIWSLYKPSACGHCVIVGA